MVTKKIFLFLLALGVFLLAWLYVNRFVMKPRADVGPNGVVFSFSNTGSTIAVDTTATTMVVLTPKTATNHVSGFDLSLKADGNLEFLDVLILVNHIVHR